MRGSFNPDRIVNNLLCVQHTNALSVQYFILNSSVCSEKSLNSHQYSLKHCSKHASRIERFTSVGIDEKEKVQRQRIASFIGHVFQLTYAALVDKLIQQEKLNHCDGCAIQHPSQNQHSCLMMDNDDAWMYYHDEVVETNRPEFYAERYQKYMQCSRLQTR